ncbi:unnamed protein product, partial [Amoebophrya sp. A120]
RVRIRRTCTLSSCRYSTDPFRKLVLSYFEAYDSGSDSEPVPDMFYRDFSEYREDASGCIVM